MIKFYTCIYYITGWPCTELEVFSPDIFVSKKKLSKEFLDIQKKNEFISHFEYINIYDYHIEYC